MNKIVLFLVVAVTCISMLSSCSDDEAKEADKANASPESLAVYPPDIGVKSIYLESLELLKKGEEMVELDESGNKSICINAFKIHNPKVKELRKIVDAKFAKSHPPLGAAFSNLVNCTSCLNSREQCEGAKENLQTVKKLYDF
ncbi:MAG: hypothetical protein O2942_09250 [Proteobacteria bacterium]|nr:hypothetical protein [Pseudomonadota bacterium]